MNIHEEITSDFGINLLKESLSIYIKEVPKENKVKKKKKQFSPSLDLNDSRKSISNFSDSEQKEIKYRIEEVSPQIRSLDHYTITKYFRNNGLVGEESLANLITLAIANNMNTIIEGDSGTGKTYLADTFLKLLPEGSVYELGLSSEQAHWRDVDKINASSLIYIPEFQKIVADNSKKTSGKMEFVKNLGEGKGVKRIITSNNGEGTISFEVVGGKTMLATTATENNFRYDRETQRRFLILETDNSKEHIEDIINNKIYKGTNIDLSDESAYIARDLSSRIEYVKSLDNIHVIKPFLGYFKNAFPIAKKVQSYVNHYIALFDAWGKFFSSERESVEIEGNTIVLPNLEDAFNIYNMYQKHFMRTIQSFNKDSEFDEFHPDWSKCFWEGLDNLKYNTNIKVKNATVNLGEEYPQVIDNWIDNQIKDGNIYTIDYKTGNEVLITSLAESIKLIPERCIDYETASKGV